MPKKRRKAINTETTPDIPFDNIQNNIYNVEGNPPHKMLELHKNYFEFI